MSIIVWFFAGIGLGGAMWVWMGVGAPLDDQPGIGWLILCCIVGVIICLAMQAWIPWKS